MAIDGIQPLSLSEVGFEPTKRASSSARSGGVTFGQLFSNALGEVNQLQLNSSKASADLAAGKIQDVSEAVIAAEKASISLQLTMTVRNKVIDAYQEIMRMQV
ncbi:MAG: flagellar hook-basal body complex protein FliE [Sporomusaceae bacterium]|nr:flagellar hook-basal body complex protein FliE [Sporomusaceae bacterium]